ncbi:hypothetical protein CRUP_018670, partial [Coryphaenoides rupestris]
VGPVQRGHDSHGGLQHAESYQRSRDNKDLGHRWAASLPEHVGALLSGVNAIVYMVDAADREKVEASRNELHNLLEKPQLQGIPVLVLGNKRDLPNALDEKQLIEKMNLFVIQDREICCYSVSCKEKDNIDITLQWLIQHSKSRRS